MLQTFKDFSTASSRRSLIQLLSSDVQQIKFVKTDGTVRTINFTLDPTHMRDVDEHLENSIRSVFLKAYDLIDNQIKSVRWSHIVSVKPAALESTPPSRSEEITLLSDLRQIGFVNGSPITDRMLLELVKMRVERETARLRSELRDMSIAKSSLESRATQHQIDLQRLQERVRMAKTYL